MLKRTLCILCLPLAACTTLDLPFPENLNAPNLELPVATAEIVSPVTVRGTGVAGASLEISILQGNTTQAQNTSTVGSKGFFNVSLPYSEPAAGTGLVIQARQKFKHSTSPVVIVAALQGTAGVFQFGADQIGGSTLGTQVFIQVYRSTGDSDYLQQQILTVSAGSNAPLQYATFNLPASLPMTLYYFRAYRDSNGNSNYDAGEPMTPWATETVHQGANAPDQRSMQ